MGEDCALDPGEEPLVEMVMVQSPQVGNMARATRAAATRARARARARARDRDRDRAGVNVRVRDRVMVGVVV